MWKFTVTPALLLSIGTLVTGCDEAGTRSNARQQDNSGPPTVFAVNFPLASFARTIGGDDVQVRTPMADGQRASTYKPTPEEIMAIQESSLILLNGAGFSSWAAHASLPASRTIRTADGFESEWIESTHSHDHDHDHDHHDHQHGPDGHGVHHGGAWASYTWLDPSHALEQARAVDKAMDRVIPGRSTASRDRSKALESELQQLVDQAARIRAAGLPAMIGSEPHYQYLAGSCGIELFEADWHWDEPEPHDGLQSLADLSTASGANLIIVPARPTTERAAVLEKMGLTAVVIPLLADPLTGRMSEASFVKALRQNLDTLEELATNQTG